MMILGVPVKMRAFPGQRGRGSRAGIYRRQFDSDSDVDTDTTPLLPSGDDDDGADDIDGDDTGGEDGTSSSDGSTSTVGGVTDFNVTSTFSMLPINSSPTSGANTSASPILLNNTHKSDGFPRIGGSKGGFIALIISLILIIILCCSGIVCVLRYNSRSRTTRSRRLRKFARVGRKNGDCEGDYYTDEDEEVDEKELESERKERLAGYGYYDCRRVGAGGVGRCLRERCLGCFCVAGSGIRHSEGRLDAGDACGSQETKKIRKSRVGRDRGGFRVLDEEDEDDEDNHDCRRDGIDDVPPREGKGRFYNLDIGTARFGAPSLVSVSSAGFGSGSGVDLASVITGFGITTGNANVNANANSNVQVQRTSGKISPRTSDIGERVLDRAMAGTLGGLGLGLGLSAVVGNVDGSSDGAKEKDSKSGVGKTLFPAGTRFREEL